MTGRIVVADDSPTDLVLLATLMEKAGFEVVAVASAAAALSAAAEHIPDLVMLDVQMPDMSGLDACLRLKADDVLAGVPVIFISAGSSTTEKLAGFGAGGVDYITKPYCAAEVAARARTHIDLYRSRQEIHLLNQRLEATNLELERLSQTDGLTGLANRACYDRALDREWRRAHRDGVPLGLLMIDVDNFKAYNDTYGHPGGDDCLRRIAHAVQGAAHRPYDLAARYGGEELVVLLPATPRDGCVIVAEHILAAVAALDITHSQSSVANHVTVSIGIGNMIPDGATQREQLVAVADRALYAAKHGGRNRFECGWARSP